MISIDPTAEVSIGCVQETLRQNLKWFVASGVMKPSDGSWGIAERVIATDNQALEMILNAFPYYTKQQKTYILEHRRADCNFETAWLFAVAATALNQPDLLKTTHNIVEYLFCRSGLLNKRYKDLPAGIWEWSTSNLKNQFYFDDNGWNCLILLLLANRFPELDSSYKLREWGLLLADTLDRALNEQFFNKSERLMIAGNPELPHWGSIACMAIAAAARISGNEQWIDTVIRYHRFLETRQDQLNTSEHAYLMIGGSIAAKALENDYLRSVVERSADLLISKSDPDTGNIASEHYEIPNGKNLVDLIYTVNWAYMGLHLFSMLTNNEIYDHAFKRLTLTLVKIQERSNDPCFNGCWRGLYDLNAREWGGGDKYEGGSGSIYTGWTNAPISISMAHWLNGDSMFDYLD